MAEVFTAAKVAALRNKLNPLLEQVKTQTKNGQDPKITEINFWRAINITLIDLKGNPKHTVNEIMEFSDTVELRQYSSNE